MAKRKLTTAQVARAIGVTRATLQDWIRRKLIPAPRLLEIGGGQVRLWDVVDIRRARKFKGTLRRGPRGPRRTA